MRGSNRMRATKRENLNWSHFQNLIDVLPAAQQVAMFPITFCMPRTPKKRHRHAHVSYIFIVNDLETNIPEL